MSAILRSSIRGFFPVMLVLLALASAFKGAVTDVGLGSRELLELLGGAASLTTGFALGLVVLGKRLGPRVGVGPAWDARRSQLRAALSALLAFGLLFIVSMVFKPNTYPPMIAVALGVGFVSAIPVYFRGRGGAMR